MRFKIVVESIKILAQMLNPYEFVFMRTTQIIYDVNKVIIALMALRLLAA